MLNSSCKLGPVKEIYGTLLGDKPAYGLLLTGSLCADLDYARAEDVLAAVMIPCQEMK